MTENQQKNLNTLKIQVFSNMALIFSKQQKWSKCCDFAGKVLEIDEKNIKCMYRQAQAYIE